MQLRSSDRARRAGSTRRFAGLLAIAATMVAALFIVTPALAVFTVPTSPSTVAVQQWQSPTISVPTGFGCTWSAAAANPTSVSLAWTNAQSWSTTQIERNVNGGAYANSGSAVAAGTSTVTNTSVTTPASNQYGWKARAVKGNWGLFPDPSSVTSAITDETCKGAINQMIDGSVSATLNNPHDVAVDSLGNVYIADTNNHRIRCIAATSRCGATVGNIYTYAGTGSSGTTDNTTKTTAQVSGPKGLWIDQYDNLLIADSGNGAVRIVYAGSGSPPATLYGFLNMTPGNMYTIAGAIGTSGYAGDNGPAIAGTARLNAPQDIATDTSNNVFIADGAGNRVRCVAAAPSTKCGGTNAYLYTFAGNGTAGWLADDVSPTSTRVSAPTGIAVTSGGDVVWTDKGTNRLRMVYEGGEGYGVAGLDVGSIYTISSVLNAPWGIAIDNANNVIIGDQGSSYVKVFFAATATRYGITTPADNSLVNVAGTGASGYNGTGLPILTSGAATIGTPYGIAIDPSNPTEVYTADNGRNIIRKVDWTNGYTFTWAGIAGTSTYLADDVPAHGWEYVTMNHTTLDSTGNIYFADSGDNRIRKWIISCGCLVVAAGSGASSSNGDGASPLLAAINAPQGVHIDSAGNMYIAETGAHKIRMIPASPMTRFTVAMTAGNIYTIMGGSGNVCGVAQSPCGDGGAIGAAHRLNAPRDVITDSSGNLIVSDSGDCEIRFVPTTAAVFFGGAARTANNIYNLGGTQLTCSSTGDGGAATSGTILVPDGITIDGSGNLLISEASGFRVRAIASSDGKISTFAGSSGSCGSIDGNATLAATFCNPRDVSYDSTTGAVYIADTGNDLVRKVLSGSVGTLAGGGSSNPGDTGPGRGATLVDPVGVAAKASGNLYVTQNGSTVDMRTIVGPDP